VTDGDSAGHEGRDQGDAGLTIEQVSRLVDLPIPTIRSWERRHKLPVVSRTGGGHRRYTSDQVETLRRMRNLVAQGRRPVDAAAQVRAENAVSPQPLIEAILQAVQDFQPSAIGEILDSGYRTLGLGWTVDEVMLPAMRQLGEWWQTGQTDVAHEHLATHASQTWLSRVSPAPASPLPFRPIILCCGPRDHHTLGLEALAALLRERGWDCRLLGARTPAGSLARVVRDTAAAAVILVCQLTAGRQSAVESLRSEQLRDTEIFYAGGAFAAPRARHDVPGRYLGEDLSQAAEFITTVLQSQPAP